MVLLRGERVVFACATDACFSTGGAGPASASQLSVLTNSLKFVSVLRRLNVHPAVRDLGFMGSSSFITAVAAMVVIAIVSKSFGAALLGEYLLIRRMASWLQAGVQVPSGVALPRYVAASLHDSDSLKLSYFFSAMLTACGIGVLLCVILLMWREQISRLLFGSAELNHLVFPLSVLLLGLAVHGVVFGYFQGILRMGRAGALQIWNIAIVPIACVVLLKRSHSIPLMVNAIGVSMMVCAVLFAAPMLRARDFRLSGRMLRKHGVELFSFGLSRLTGDFGLQALLSLPAVIATRYFPLSSVASLLLAGSFLTAVAAATMPLGVILLSRMSRSIAELGSSQMQTRISHLVSALIELSIFLGLQTVVFADVIVRLWVGPRFLEDLQVIQIAIVAVPFYFVHAGLRGAVDAAAVKAYNARNAYVGLTAFFVSVLFVRMFVAREHLLAGLAAAGVAGMVVLAGCTLATVRHLFEMKIDWRGLVPGMAIGVFFAGLSVLFHREFGNETGLIPLLIYQAVLVVLYVAVLALINAPWVSFLRRMMVTYTAPKEEASD